MPSKFESSEARQEHGKEKFDSNFTLSTFFQASHYSHCMLLFKKTKTNQKNTVIEFYSWLNPQLSLTLGKTLGFFECQFVQL